MGQVSGLVPAAAPEPWQGLALLHPVQGDLLLAAEGRLLKGDGQPHPQALAPLGTVPCPAAAEAPAEEAAEDIPQVPKSKPPSKPPPNPPPPAA